ncbi:MAG: methionine--tRNA ligase [Lachnospiraceae bacterium]|nr:methionine--tRNA ligase [Lachnospiraceae bacterium]
MCKNCKKPYYITTAIAYTSGKPHIGNTYEIVLADSIARFRREQGFDVRFQTGTDEHGQKIEEKAKAAGVTPQTFVDEVAAEIRRIWDLMNTSYDKFIRTTDKDHEVQIQKVFKKLYDQGDIYKGYYEGMYCTPCESFFTESQLVDGKCPDCGRPVQPAKEEAYFFKMSKYAQRLIDHINAHPEFIQPVSRKNEMMNNFLLPGLQDLCVSRTSFSWGIPVSFDPKHVTYVWLDALTNYITGLGYDVDGNHGELWAKYWPADLHLIGKDIIRFHTIYWPIFLMALDLPLPKQVFGHPWLLQGDGKMSKSKGNVLYADDLVKVFGVDAVRYFVLHEMPFDNDGIISWELMVERMNSDLANILGNLVKRTISMSNQYFGGIVENRSTANGEEAAIDQDLKETVLAAVAKAEEKMDQLRVADAITAIFEIFRRSNKYIDETTPWTLAKDEAKKDRLATVLYHLAESITIGASLLESFMPETSAKILAQLNTKKRSLEEIKTAGFGQYVSGNKVTDTPEILFARLDAKKVLAEAEEIQKAQAAAVQAETAQEGGGQDGSAQAASENGGASAAGEKAGIDLETKPEITYEDFARLQFQVGEIIACEAVKKSRKLLCSQVKVGSQVRQIVSGIKADYTPEEMIGKKVMVVTNLKPAKLAGILSEGMLLCAEDAEGRLALMTPEKDMPSGAEIC